MQRVGLVVGVLVLAFWVLAVVSCVLTPPSRVRGLPKPLWLLLLVLLPLLGGVLWFAVGRSPAPPIDLRSAPVMRSGPRTYGQLAADERIRRMEEDLARLERETDHPDGDARPGSA